MKFMKLGSKPDLFQSGGEHIRYIATDLASDIVVIVGDIKFFLHKFPLLSKSAHLQKLIAINKNHDIQIHDLPGGPAAFEICAKFCYGMTVTLNAYNVILALCAAEYLEMYETMDKGNLVYKIEIFLNSSIFKTWKDSIIVLQTTRSFRLWSEELKVVNHCLDSIASKASIDTSKVNWSYTYNRNKSKKQLTVPKDWWVEDVCDLSSDLYKRVMTMIKSKGEVSSDVIGKSLSAYTQRKLPWFGKIGGVTSGDDVKNCSLIETIISLLPDETSCIFCGFLVRLLHASVLLNCDEMLKKELMRKIGQQLQNASVDEIVILDVDLVQELVGVFMIKDQGGDFVTETEFLEVKCVDFGSKVKVAKLVDGYLAEIAKDPNLPLSKFVDLGDMVSSLSRSSHDGIYRAVDMFLKEHPGISKTEKKRICRLMDCRKLSADTCRHAVQNERLPLRVVVQVIFFDQIRAADGTPREPSRAVLPGGSQGSSRSTATNTEEEWDSVPTSEELTSLRLNNNVNDNSNKVFMSKRVLMKLFSRKDEESENGSSDTSGSS